MIRFLMILSLLMGFQKAWADGFVCQNKDHNVRIKVFNHVHPDLGTRRAAIMIFSSIDREYGERTQAVFRDESGALSNEGPNYLGYFGLREDGYLDKEVKILGKSIDDLYSAFLRIDFSYEHPLPHGTTIDGELVIVERNANRLYLDVKCHRYLKSAKKAWNFDL